MLYALKLITFRGQTNYYAFNTVAGVCDAPKITLSRFGTRRVECKYTLGLLINVTLNLMVYMELLPPPHIVCYPISEYGIFMQVPI